eukprot:TRINITY_DN35050_c0_g1_i2.p1 TRINITY_DN35050_c0_g1~~TRINITY_DN35050_c0_g1_i2.p1  ORF type:complete len:360 (-),score=50.78 TRINITY_DN35050_c0_g1_i2:80-1159(-)
MPISPSARRTRRRQLPPLHQAPEPPRLPGADSERRAFADRGTSALRASSDTALRSPAHGRSRSSSVSHLRSLRPHLQPCPRAFAALPALDANLLRSALMAQHANWLQDDASSAKARLGGYSDNTLRQAASAFPRLPEVPVPSGLLQGVAGRGDSAALARLLEARAHPAEARGDGLLPLHFAAQGGHIDCVQLLVAAQSPLNPAGPGGFRPLHDAAIGGYTAVVQVLLEARADPTAAAEDGTTALHAAAGKGHADTVAELLNHAAPHSAVSSGGFTPLHDAAYAGHLPVVQQLLTAKARPTRATDGATPLHLALKAGHANVAEVLRRHMAEKRTVVQSRRRARSEPPRAGCQSSTSGLLR